MLGAARPRKAAWLGGARVLVGISWRTTNADHAAGKSVSLLLWGPVLHIPGVTFVNLQYGDCAAELEAVRKGFGVSVVHDATSSALKSDPTVLERYLGVAGKS